MPPRGSGGQRGQGVALEEELPLRLHQKLRMGPELQAPSVSGALCTGARGGWSREDNSFTEHVLRACMVPLVLHVLSM